MDHTLTPFKRCRALVVRGDEAIDRLAQLPHRRETRALQGAPTEDTEPALDLVEPAGARGRVVEMHTGMARQPAVVFRFVRIEVVEDDVQLAIGIVGDDRAVSTSVRQPVSEFTEAPPRARSGKGPGRREAVAVCL